MHLRVALNRTAYPIRRTPLQAALLLELDSSVTLLQSLIDVHRSHPHAANESTQPQVCC